MSDTNIKYIDNVLAESTDISVRSKNRAVYVLILAASVVMGYISVQFQQENNLGFLLFFVAVILAAVGFAGAFKPKKYMQYNPTGEIVKEYSYYFDAADKKAVSIAINSGELELLKTLTSQENTNMRAIVYATPSLSYVASQMQKYIPHAYIPAEETVICNMPQAS